MKDRIGHLVRRGGGLVRLPGARRRPVIAAVTAATLVIAALAAVSATTTPAASASGRAAYLNSAAPVQARVAQLLGQMTLAEKIGQMVQIEVTQVTDTNNSCTSQGGFNMPNPVCEQKIFVDNNVGSILAGGTDIPIDTTGQHNGVGNTGLDWAN
jgi:beta-glucosidase